MRTADCIVPGQSARWRGKKRSEQAQAKQLALRSLSHTLSLSLSASKATFGRLCLETSRARIGRAG